MSARDEILAALRRAALPAQPPPDLTGLGVRFDDPIQQLAGSVAAVGGTFVRVADLPSTDRRVVELPVYREAKQVVSLVDGVGRNDLDLAALTDPHQLASLGLAILPGEIAVAENGAVWVDGAALAHRAVFVIAEHLALVVQARDVVNDMHEACARLAAGPPRYGTFISGPSKTADIEQSLVIGAHGARSLTLLLVG